MRPFGNSRIQPGRNWKWKVKIIPLGKSRMQPCRKWKVKIRPFGKSRMQRCRKRKQWRKVQERQQWWDWLCRTPWLNGVGCFLSIFIGVFCYQFLLVLSSLVGCYHFLLVFIFVDCVVSTLSLSWVGSKPAMMLQTQRLVLFHKLNSKAAFEIWGGSSSRRGSRRRSTNSARPPTHLYLRRPGAR